MQENNLNSKSYGRAGNLVDELYAELVEKTPELKKLEEEFDALKLKPKNTIEDFEKYEARSNNYYSNAVYKSSAIKDSLLRNKILEVITSSKEKYKDKTANLNGLVGQISKNQSTLNDHHEVMKIILTLGLIQQYQNGNIPDQNAFKELIYEQNKFTLRIDSITPKY